MKIISTSQPSIYFLILIGTPFLGCFSYYLRHLFQSKDDTAKLGSEYPLMFAFLMFIGELLAICFEFIQFYINKKRTVPIHHNATIHRKAKIKVVINTQTQLNQSFPYLAIIFSAFLDFSGSIMLLRINQMTPGKYREGEIGILQVFITMGVSLYLFHYEIHRHQILSVCIITLGSLLLYFSDNKFNIADLWFILQVIIHSALLLLDKWVIEKRYTSPFKMLSFRGFVGLIITLITIGIGSVACDERMWYCESFSTFGVFFHKQRDVWHYLIVVLLFLLLNTGYILIIKHYDPSQRVVTMSITNVLILFLMLILVHLQQEGNLALCLIGNFLILIGAVIYNEIIILYFFGLEYGTKKEIDLRSKNEVNTICLHPLNLVDEDEDEDNDVIENKIEY